MGQEDRKRVGDDAQLAAAVGAVEADDEVGEQARSQHAHAEVARDLALLPLRAVRPDVVAGRAVFQQAGDQQQTVRVRRRRSRRRRRRPVSTLQTFSLVTGHYHAPFHASVLRPASQVGPMHKAAGMGKLVNAALLSLINEACVRQ